MRAAPSVPAVAPERLRIAQVVTRMDIGGVPDHVMTLVRGLHPSAAVTLFCATIDPRHALELEALGVPVVPIGFTRLPDPVADLRAFRRLVGLLRNGAFDIVHTHMSKAVMLGAPAARLARVPVVINTAHNLGFLALRQPLLRGLFWLYDRALFTVCDRVVTVSDEVRDRTVRAWIAPAAKVVAIANGIDPARFRVAAAKRAALRAELAQDDGPLLLTVARLVWFKGLDTLIDALPPLVARHPALRLVIVGEGTLRAALTDQAERLGLGEHVRFTGERADVPALLAAADLFVLPSVSEGMPISILEAMAAGRAVVATRVGGVPELIEEGQTGLVVPARDAGALAEALDRLIADPALRARMGGAGAARLASEFSAEAMVARTRALYRTCRREKAGRCV